MCGRRPCRRRRARRARHSSWPAAARSSTPYSRTLTRSEKAGSPSTSDWSTSDESTSVSSASNTSKSHSRSRPSASTESSVNPGANTASSVRRRRDASSSSPADHSIVDRSVRCRSGRSRDESTSRASCRSSRRRMSAGVSTRVRAAASSIARGTPSSTRQIPTTAARFASVSSNVGLAADARSANSSTAGAVRARASESGDARSWVASGPTSYTRSPRTRSTTRLVTRNAASGAIVYSCTRIGAALTICSKLSSTNSIRRLSSARARRSSSCKPVVSRMPSAYPIVDRSSSGSRRFSSGTNTMPSGKSAAAASAAAIESLLLPIPPGPHERHQSGAAVAEERDDVLDRLVAADDPRQGRGQVRFAVQRSDDGRLRARLVEALGEQSREVGGHLLLELGGGVEGEVRGGVVGSDPVDQPPQALVAVSLTP